MSNIFYTNCPRCTGKTERDINNKITCTQCGFTWFPIDIQLADMAQQITTINQAILELDDKLTEVITNLNGAVKQIQHQQNIIGKISSRIITIENPQK